ncbi:MAG: hypothetical protein KDC87_12755 [Planctomycetes bacterium]|nr:hypothetical protein [Planctomycetota bacterium]
MSRSRILLLFLVFVALLGSVTYFVLLRAGASTGLVEAMLGKAIRRDLFQLASAQIDVTSGTVTIRDFKLDNPVGRQPLLAAQQVSVQVSTNPLGELGVPQRIDLHKLELHLSLADGELPELGQILTAATGAPQKPTKEHEIPALRITDSIVHLRFAPARPAVTFRDVRVSFLPVADQPGRMVLQGSMVSPHGHRLEIHGEGAPRDEQFKAVLSVAGVPIAPEQVEAFHAGAARYLQASGVRGKVDKAQIWAEVHARGTPGPRVTGGVTVDMAELSCSPAEFPYPLDGGRGKVVATLHDGGTVAFEVTREEPTSKLSMTGRVTQCFADPQLTVEVVAHDVPFDQRLQRALAESSHHVVREVYAALRPTAGTLSGTAQVYLTAPGQQVRAALDLDLKDVTAAYHGFLCSDGKRRGFPYPLHSLSGKVSVRPDMVTLHGLDARDHREHRVTISGTVALTGNQGYPSIDIHGEALEFSGEVRKALDQLVSDGGLIYDQYAPRGNADVDCQVRRTADTFGFSVELRPKRASVAYAPFPYRLEQVTGRVAITDSGVWIDLEGARGPAKATVRGKFLFDCHPAVVHPPPDGLRSELWVRGTGVAFDGELRQAVQAFDAKLDQLWEGSQPRGSLGVEFTMWRGARETSDNFDMHLAVRDGSIKLREFPLPMRQMEGDLFVHGTGNTARCDISPLRGVIANGPDEPPARVLVQGTIRNDSKGLSSDVTTVIRRLRLTESVGDALHAGGVFDHAVWSALALDGYVDVTAHQHRATGASRLDQRFRVHLRDVCSAAPMLPGKAHDIRGEIVVANGNATFERLEGSVDSSRLEAWQGSLRSEDGAMVFELLASAESIPVDARLANLMSPPLRKAYLACNPSGRAKLNKVGLRFRFPADGSAFQAGFKGDIELRDLDLDVGLPGGHTLRNLTGTVSIKDGRIDDKGGRLEGQLRGTRFALSNQQIHDIHCRFLLDRERLTVHDLSCSFAGGTVLANGQDKLSLKYEFAGEGNLQAFVLFRGLRLERLLRGDGPALPKARGKLEGRLWLDKLQGSDFLNMSGRGEFVVSEGKLGAVPLFSAIYSYIREEKRPQFDMGKAVFELANQKVKLTEFHARSNLLKIEGTGWLDLDGYINVELHVPRIYGSATDILIVPTLINKVMSNILKVRVIGYLRNPILEPVPLFGTPPKRLPLTPIPPLPGSTGNESTPPAPTPAATSPGTKSGG